VSPPPNDGTIGDGLSRFEEYRGFIVSGLHRRMDPRVKDLLGSSNVTWQGANIGLQFAFPNLPVLVHRIIGEDESPTPEYRSGDRVINANYQNAGFGGAIAHNADQKAIRVELGDALGVAGFTFPIGFDFQTQNPGVCNEGGLTPNDVDHIEINPSVSQDEGNRNNDTLDQVLNEISRSVGHEIGHGLHMKHRPPPIQTTCDDGADVGTSDSIMSTAWFYGPDMNDPLSQYNAFDVRQIRVKIP
jgi:hypothetical protein